MQLPRIVLLAGLLSLLTSARVADAKKPTPAEALFDQGLKEMQAGNYEKACPPIEQSYRIEPLPGTLFTLAQCEAERGRLASAVARYDEYLAIYPKLSRDPELSRDLKARHKERAQVARRHKSLIEPDVPQLTLVLPPGAARDTVVQCDGVQVSSDSLGTPFPVDPGEHVVTTLVAGEALSQFRVKLSKGEKLLLRLTHESKSVALRPAVAAAAAAPPEGDSSSEGEEPSGSEGEEPSGARRVGTYIAGGAGLAGLIFGGIMGGLALGQKSTVDANCDADRICNEKGKKASDDLQRFGLMSTVGLGVGLAGSVVAVVLIATAPDKGSDAPVAGVKRLTAGVLSAGPDGGMLGVKGAW